MKRDRVATALHWLRDSLRLIGGFVFWNARKSAYVARQRRGRCPCQNISDDSIPGRVRCNVVVHWHQPERFRTVCPLLVQTEHGWCCSVNASEVRPFWGRAVAWLSGLLVVTYLALALSAWGGLRLAGNSRATFVQVAWPGKWHELRNVQADVLFNHALDALKAGRVADSYLALTSAQTRDQHHYPSARLLAVFTMFQGSYLFADGMFERLIAEFPEQRASTAIAYHDTLLSLGRLDRVAEFSLQMAVTDRQHAALWVRSMIIALRRQPDVLEKLVQHDADIRALAPHAQLLLEGERALAKSGRAEAIAVLSRRFTGAMNFIYMEQQVERLAELGAPREAQALLDYYGPFMGEFDQALAQYALDAQAGDQASRAASFRHLMKLPLTAARVERIADRIVRTPSVSELSELHARVLGGASELSHDCALAMWIAALASGDLRKVVYWADECRAQGRELPQLVSIDYASRDVSEPDSVVHLVTVVPLPREIVLTLMTKAVPRPPRLFRELR